MGKKSTFVIRILLLLSYIYIFDMIINMYIDTIKKIDDNSTTTTIIIEKNNKNNHIIKININ